MLAASVGSQLNAVPAISKDAVSTYQAIYLGRYTAASLISVRLNGQANPTTDYQGIVKPPAMQCLQQVGSGSLEQERSRDAAHGRPY